MYCFEASVQLVPKFLPFLVACLNWNWTYCKSFFCSWLCSTSPQIYITKVKLEGGQSPNIFSEIIIPGENGGCGGNIPIFDWAWPIVHWKTIDSINGTLWEKPFHRSQIALQQLCHAHWCRWKEAESTGATLVSQLLHKTKRLPYGTSFLCSNFDWNTCMGVNWIFQELSPWWI